MPFVFFRLRIPAECNGSGYVNCPSSCGEKSTFGQISFGRQISGTMDLGNNKQSAHPFIIGEEIQLKLWSYLCRKSASQSI